MNKTPLYQSHVRLNARMAAFAGWDMPIQYTSIIEEHLHTRRSVSIFDTCHMGEFFIQGDCALSNLEQIVTIPLERMPVNKCRYGFMLNENGGILDDLIIYRLGQNDWMAVVNAATASRDAEHFKKHMAQDAHFEDRSSLIAKLDIQGPLSADVLVDMTEETDIRNLNRYSSGYVSILGQKCIVSRTGYTGEKGFEIYISPDKAPALWERLLAYKDVRPAGLGARDTLRMEMGYPLYGQDIDESTTPLEAGMARFIDFSKDFIGKEALEKQSKQGVSRIMAGLMSDSRKSLRHNDEIMYKGRNIGTVTSGTFSPCLEKGIGMGYIKHEYFSVKDSLEVRDRRGSVLQARVADFPLYHPA